ncbi:MAG TPA: 50S ribosomal protein L31 [Thermomicrobiales bacterium]
MKPGIHPQYVEAQVICACGNTFTTRSTKPVLRTDLCNVCHPFFTGEQRIVDTAGQVERFMRRLSNVSTEPYVSKRQQRLRERQARLEAERRRQEELAAQAAAEEAAARAAREQSTEAETGDAEAAAATEQTETAETAESAE